MVAVSPNSLGRVFIVSYDVGFLLSLFGDTR